MTTLRGRLNFRATLTFDYDVDATAYEGAKTPLDAAKIDEESFSADPDNILTALATRGYKVTVRPMRAKLASAKKGKT